MNTRSRLIVFILILALVFSPPFQRRAHAIALFLSPVAIAGLAAIATYAGVTIYKDNSAATIVDQAASTVEAARWYLADLGNNAVTQIRLTMSLGQIAAKMATNLGRYPYATDKANYDWTIDSSRTVPPPKSLTVGEVFKGPDGSLRTVTAIAVVTAYCGNSYYASGFVRHPAPWQMEIFTHSKSPCFTGSGPLASSFTRYTHAAASPGSTLPGKPDHDNLKANFANKGVNDDIKLAMDDSFDGFNPDHSKLPTNYIKTSNGTILTMQDVLDTRAFKASKDAVSASNAALDATSAALATATAIQDEALQKNSTAEAALAAAAAAKTAAELQFSSDPSNSAYQAALTAAQTTYGNAQIAYDNATKAYQDARAGVASATIASASVASSSAVSVSDIAAVDAVDVSLPDANVYDASVTPPPKKDISALLSAFVAASPLSRSLKALTVENANPQAQIHVDGGIYNQSMIFDFSSYETLMRSCGAVLVLIMQGSAILIVVRGW